jgi:hypothetical protein
MSQYYLYIDTDGDFYLQIYVEKYFYEDIKIKASNFEKLRDLVNNISVVKRSNHSIKYEMGQDLIRELKKQVNRKNAQSGSFGGNHRFEFGPIEEPEYDIVV